MTLYPWIHWFWITALCVYGVMGELNTTKSLLTNSSELEDTNNLLEASKNSTDTRSPFHNNLTITNSSIRFSIQKSSKVKQQKPFSKYGLLTISIQPNTSKDYVLNGITVINQNVSDEFLNISDSQINASFTTINRTIESNSTYSGNETSFNQSYLLNSEQVGIQDLEMTSGKFSAAGITGIFFCCVVIVGIFSSVSYFLYSNRGLNRPQVLNDHCSNPDSSGYLDDASVRDNSEEMYSLDNDSFLNSLEAMTIQNYWTDTVKHTKL